jgi:predicted DNA-binding ribbon-helix-helix protein
MKSSVVKRFKRSIVIDGHKTSVSLEDAFWTDLKTIAHAQQVTLSELVTRIDDTREQNNLSSAIRLFVLNHFRNEDRRMEVAEAHLSVSAERTPAS